MIRHQYQRTYVKTESLKSRLNRLDETERRKTPDTSENVFETRENSVLQGEYSKFWIGYAQTKDGVSGLGIAYQEWRRHPKTRHTTYQAPTAHA